MNDHNLPFVYLTNKQLAGLKISTFDICAAIEDAIVQQSKQQLWTAPKAAILPGDGRYIMSTLSVADLPGLIACKSVMVAPDNATKDLPAINGAIMLLDSQTGELRGVIEANWVTAVRTAGLSAVAAKQLANPNSRSIGFIGSGVQALSHLGAFCDLFPIEQIKVFSRGQANIEKLCDHASHLGLHAEAVSSAEKAVLEADIVVSSITLSYQVAPFISANWLKPGAFAAITDLAIPWLADSMTAFDKIIIDDHEQEKAAETPMVKKESIYADLQEMVTEQKHCKFDANKRSAFAFRGMAIGDFAVSALAYQRAAQYD